MTFHNCREEILFRNHTRSQTEIFNIATAFYYLSGFIIAVPSLTGDLLRGNIELKKLEGPVSIPWFRGKYPDLLNAVFFFLSQKSLCLRPYQNNSYTAFDLISLIYMVRPYFYLISLLTSSFTKTLELSCISSEDRLPSSS